MSDAEKLAYIKGMKEMMAAVTALELPTRKIEEIRQIFVEKVTVVMTDVMLIPKSQEFNENMMDLSK